MQVSRRVYSQDRNKGEIVFGILIFEDLIAILLVAILTAVAAGGGLSPADIGLVVVRLATFLIALLSIGILLVPRFMRIVVRLGSDETTLVAAIGICFACAFLALSFGYSVALGAFIAGSLVSESGEEKAVERLVLPVRDMFVAIFFVSVGMLIDPGVIVAHWGAVLVLAGVVIVGKVIAVSISAFLTGNGLGLAVQSGMSLAQVGEFSFIIAAIGLADSIVIDPHKHGLQPYGCGCVLFRDPAVGRFYKHDSPATYFTSKDLQLGQISLECSRAGAAAVALWATQRLLPLVPGGAFAQGLAKGRRAALELDSRVRGDVRFEALAAGGPELDIVVWALRAATPQEASERAQKVFDACAVRGLNLALVQLPPTWFGFGPRSSFGQAGREGFGQVGREVKGSSTMTCLRSVLMKPEHEAWMDEIWDRLSAACD